MGCTYLHAVPRARLEGDSIIYRVHVDIKAQNSSSAAFQMHNEQIGFATSVKGSHELEVESGSKVCRKWP